MKKMLLKLLLDYGGNKLFKIVHFGESTVLTEGICDLYKVDAVFPQREMFSNGEVLYSLTGKTLFQQNTNGQFIADLQSRLFQVSDLVAVYSNKIIGDFKDLKWNIDKVRYFPIPFSDFTKFNNEDHINRENRFVIIGRLAKEKNISAVIKAASKLNNMQLDIIGDGTLKNELVELSNKLGVNVKFYGFINEYKEIQKIMKKAKALILPSTYDCFGLVILEAFQCGVPALISNGVGGIQISEKLRRYSFDPNDVETLAQRMKIFLNPNEEFFNDMLSIQSDVISHHKPKDAVSKLVNIYNETINI